MLILSKLKKILIYIIFIFIILSCNSYAVVKPTKDFYVNDYANVLSQETENYIMNANIELQNKTGAQIVIVTVPSLDGQSVEEYATELFRNFGIGNEEKNNGVLLLCSTGDREFRIEVGYGLEGRLTDGKTGRIQDEYIIPYLSNDNYDEGIKNGFSAILQEVAEEYNVNIEGSQNATAYSNGSELIIQGTITSFVFTVFVRTIMDVADVKKKNKLKIISIYSVILAIIAYWISKSFIITTLITLLNIMILIVAFFSKPSKYRRRSWRRILWSAEVSHLEEVASQEEEEDLLVAEEAQEVSKKNYYTK